MWTTLKIFLYFEILCFGNICGVKLGVSVSSKSFSLGYSAPCDSSFIVWLCRSWLLMGFSINRPHHLVQTLFCLCLQYPGLLALAFCFNTMVNSLMPIPFHLWMDKIKAAHNEQIFLEVKFDLVRDIERIFLLTDRALCLLKSSV